MKWGLDAAIIAIALIITIPGHAYAQEARRPLLNEFSIHGLERTPYISSDKLPLEPTPYATVDRPFPSLGGAPSTGELTMYPPTLRKTPGDDEEVALSDVLVRNFGAERIHFTYLVKVEWKSEDVDPGKLKRLHCDDCADAIKIAFNDGAEDRSVDAGLGLSYAFYWGTSDKRWHLEPANTALQRIGLSQPVK